MQDKHTMIDMGWWFAKQLQLAALICQNEIPRAKDNKEEIEIIDMRDEIISGKNDKKSSQMDMHELH